MDLISQEDLEVQAILRSAVAEALERKRRLGQYAVVWRDGKPVLIGDDAPGLLTASSNVVGLTTSSGSTAFEESDKQSSSTQEDNHE